MKMIYTYCGIRRQAHFQALNRIHQGLEVAQFVEALIMEIRILHPGMSLRKIYNKAQPEGIGRDAFINLGMNLGFRLRKAQNKARTTFSLRFCAYSNLLKGKRFTDVNQIWSADITYFRFLDNFYYISLLMDVYSRRIIGYALGTDLRTIHSLKALKMALQLRGKKTFEKQLIHHSDKGTQYLSNAYTQTLQQYQINISTADSVYENAHIERANGTIKNQYLTRWNIKSFKQLNKALERAVWAYNFDRPHDSLMGKTPVDFEAYIKELNRKDRPVLEIFTFDYPENNFYDPMQLAFDFNL